MLERLQELLTASEIRLYREPAIEIIDSLARALSELYDVSKAQGRLIELKRACQNHPIAKLFLEDPYVRRAVEKPRGYAGDAVMLDYIYKPGSVRISSVMGSSIHSATITLPNAQSILWRRDYLSGKIGAVQFKGNGGRVFSVASGHMRELDTLSTVIDREDVEIWALDQDNNSLEECKRSYPHFQIKLINKSIKFLLKDNPIHNDYELIYSAGLSDYLTDKTLKALIYRLYNHLKPDGILTIGNFTTNSHGRGFMECFMDWSLIYRDEQDLIQIAREVVPSGDHTVFRDGPGNVAYLEIRRT